MFNKHGHMGVRTKAFGPHAWRVLEGLARERDILVEKLANRDAIEEYDRLFLYMVYSLSRILPCVFCRISVARFAGTQGADIDPVPFLKRPLGAQRFIHAMHNRVTQKLRDQAVMILAEQEPPASEIDINKTAEEWNRRMLRFETALSVSFPRVHTLEWWNSFMAFGAYMLCDWDKFRAKSIWTTMAGIGKMLRISKNSQEVQDAGTMVEARVQDNTRLLASNTIAERIEAWFACMKGPRHIMGFAPPPHPTVIYRICQSDIVGCDLAKKKT